MTLRMKIGLWAIGAIVLSWLSWNQRGRILEKVDPRQRTILGNLALVERVTASHGFPEVRFTIKSSNGKVDYEGVYGKFPNIRAIMAGETPSTAFLIANGVAVTAAHNFEDESINGKIKLIRSGKEAVCEPHPCWVKGKPGWDVGRCVWDEAGGSSDDLLLFMPKPREKLAVRGDWLFGQEVVVAGFGCLSLPIGSCDRAGFSGTLNLGQLKVLDATAATESMPSTMVLAGPSERNGAQVCPGDSGGPVLKLEKFETDGTAVLAGIVGMVSARDCDGGKTLSRLTVFDESTIAWLETKKQITCPSS